MPWYLTALELSRPLHFGDYGGLPLKIIWAVLDLITIVVLVSGLYLWLARRRATEALSLIHISPTAASNHRTHHDHHHATLARGLSVRPAVDLSLIHI